MSEASIANETIALAPSEVFGIWRRHLIGLLFPLGTIFFLLTGPHHWAVALLFFALPIYWHKADAWSPDELRTPNRALPAWPFDLLVYLLAFLQLGIIVLLVRMYSQQSVFSMDMAMAMLLIGGSSGFSIINAHELIHRSGAIPRLLGRLSLCTVMNEHFYTEHLRGHHVRVGTPEDPATARFGESFNAFYRRTIPGQLRSAWRLETRRLGDVEMPLLDPRQRGNRVLHGLVVSWGMAFGILFGFGVAPFVAFLLQAFSASRLLEAVNYMEHWGLTRTGRRVAPEDSWDSYGRFTYYSLTGLSRHADHHAYPSRPFQQLRVFEEAPRLPGGYINTLFLVFARNDVFQRLASAELERRQLGPFRPGTESSAHAPP